MDINYLYSIVNLYLSKENDEKKTNLNIIKISDEEIQFNFNMNEKLIEVTSLVLPFEKVFNNDNLTTFLQLYKQKFIIIDERYEYDKENDLYDYFIKFNNGRKIAFCKFELLEINNIRNVIYNIKIQKEEIRVVFEDEHAEEKVNFALRLQQTGYANYVMLLLFSIGFLLIFILSLWIFDIFIK